MVKPIGGAMMNDLEITSFFGDVNGNPVRGNAFKIECTKAWNDSERFYGGPCHFRPTHPGNIIT